MECFASHLKCGSSSQAAQPVVRQQLLGAAHGAKDLLSELALGRRADINAGMVGVRRDRRINGLKHNHKRVTGKAVHVTTVRLLVGRRATI